MLRVKKSSKAKNQKMKINKSMFLNRLIDFSDMKNCRENKVFKVRISGKEKYISLLSVSGIDIFHYTPKDMEAVFQNFAKATMSIRLPHKYVFSNSYQSFAQQIDFLKYKLRKSKHTYTKAMLEKKIEQLKYFEENHKTRMAYLIIFGDNAQEVRESYERYIGEMRDTSAVTCDLRETIDFFSEYMCFNSEIKNERDYSKPNDLILPDKIEFAQNSFNLGGQYATSIVVNDYPAYIKDLELANLVSTYPDTVITFDVMQRPKMEVKEEISRSLEELQSRTQIKLNVSEQLETGDEFQKLRQIFEDLSRGAEQLFYTTLRFTVSAGSLKELSKKANAIAEDLEGRGLNFFVPINQMKEEFIGLASENNTIQTPYPLFDTYARQYPFYYQAHSDPKGMFFGYTDTGGLNVLNTFYRNTSIGRNSYDILISGLKGGGKSATLKSMVEDQLIVGNKVMMLDIESEYNEIARMYNGQIVKMNLHSGINPLQIRMTIDVETENIDADADDRIRQEDALAVNFAAEISRICTFLYQFAPSFTIEQMADFQDILIEVFKSKGITNQTDITKLQPEDFPVFSDVLDYIRKKSTGKLTELERLNLKKLEVQIKPLTKLGAYGAMFDNYTNVNIDDSNLIVFNVQSISELDVNVYNACLFNLLSIMWAEICVNREKNKHISNEYDRRYVVCLIDEAHRFISAKYPKVAEFIEKLLRRTRKYDAGLWFASQAMIDFMSADDSEEAKSIKVILQLVQYKFIMLQNTDSVNVLQEVFGQFTRSEIESTTGFEAGEMLISLSSGRHKLHCRRAISDASMLYCGNSQDRNEIVHKIFDDSYNEMSYAEYGRMLLEDKRMEENFVVIFASEVIEYLGFRQSDSEYLMKIITNAALNLKNELMNRARENSYE